MVGESLREKANPSVSELILKRIASLLATYDTHVRIPRFCRLTRWHWFSPLGTAKLTSMICEISRVRCKNG